VTVGSDYSSDLFGLSKNVLLKEKQRQALDILKQKSSAFKLGLDCITSKGRNLSLTDQSRVVNMMRVQKVDYKLKIEK